MLKNPYQFKRQQIKIILDVASEAMSKNVQQVQEKQQPDPTANAYLCYLIEALAKEVLTKEQQQQVQAILDMRYQCVYPALDQ